MSKYEPEIFDSHKAKGRLKSRSYQRLEIVDLVEAFDREMLLLL